MARPDDDAAIQASATTLDDRQVGEATTLTVVEPDRYEIIGEVGRGGLGRVLEVRDPRLDRTVALKELVDHDPEARARFLREAVVTARLEHPSIVPVHEAGCWPSGDPFYVMKLVSGRSLDVAASSAATLAERTALLPNVVAVAEAVAYAHSQGVIHRDLKPQNVLLGAFGETVVIDWGLAKYVQSPEEPISNRRAPAAGSTDMTEMGTVMGTPAYMPPEQVAGARVDERADVYALGAILYHVFSGRPPYVAGSAAEVLEAVLLGPPPPLAQKVPDLPDDLLAIVERAMARDPAARYPSARELAQDLRRFTAGQLVASHRYTPGELVRRWLRRYRGPLAVALVAVVILAGMGAAAIGRILAERRRAEDQRALAEKRTAVVEDLMSFMLFDLGDKLFTLGRLDLLAPVARKAAAYYGEPSPDDDATTRHRRSVALLHIGDVMRGQGDSIGAMADYRAALVVAEDLARRDPANHDAPSDIGDAHERLGQTLVMQADAPGGTIEFCAERDVFAQALARDARDPIAFSRLVEATVDTGNAYSARGMFTEATAEYRRGQAAAEQAIQTLGAGVRTIHDLVRVHEAIGSTLIARGDLEGGVAELRVALGLAVSARSTASIGRQLDRDIYTMYMKLGDALATQAVVDGALAEYGAAQALITELMVAGTSDADLLRDLTLTTNHIGIVLVDRGDFAGAESAFRIGLTMFAREAAADPLNVEWQRGLYLGHSRLGRMYEAKEDWTRALDEYRECLRVVERQIALDPGEGEWQNDLVQVHEHTGTAHAALRHWDLAVAEVRQAADLEERRAARNPTDMDVRKSMLGTYDSMADILLRKGDAAGALAADDRAMALAAEFIAQDPSGRDTELVRNSILAGRADALAALHRWDEALGAARAGLEGTAELVELDPSNVEWQDDLVAAHTQVAGILRQQGQRAAARRELQLAIDVAEAGLRRDLTNRQREDPGRPQAVLARRELDSI